MGGGDVGGGDVGGGASGLDCSWPSFSSFSCAAVTASCALLFLRARSGLSAGLSLLAFCSACFRAAATFSSRLRASVRMRCIKSGLSSPRSNRAASSMMRFCDRVFDGGGAEAATGAAMGASAGASNPCSMRERRAALPKGVERTPRPSARRAAVHKKSEKEFQDIK